MRRSAIPVLSLLFLAFPLALPVHAQQDTRWQIHLDRPSAAGDRFTVRSNGKQQRHTVSSLPGQNPENATDFLEITYAATHEVLATGQNGLPTRMRLTIDRLETDDGSGPQEQFAAGTVIEARAEGDNTHYFQDRDELEGTVNEALNLAGANLPSENEVSEDDVFNNHSALLPGGKLQADPKRLAKAISKTTPFRLGAEESTGEVVFERAAEEDGVPALVTQSTFRILLDGFKSSPGQPLKDSRIQSSTLRIFPIDPSLPLLHESLDTEMRISSRPLSAGSKQEKTEEPEAEDEEKHGFTTVFRREATRDYKPLPPAPAGSKP